MRAYQDITLLPGPEIGLHFLWSKIYQQVHLGLVEIQDAAGHSPIGIALPEYDPNIYRLGSKLRLFALDAITLEKYNAKKRLANLSDYVHITSIRKVPENIQKFAVYKRQQPKSSTERMARRKAKRAGIGVVDALKLLEGRKEQLVNTPFIFIKSQSSEQTFRLFIEKKSVIEACYEGFSTYGLGQKSSVPDF